MLCKWCGAELPDYAPKCKRCGKDVPAISDCGGFYDLMPGAKKPAAKKEPLQDAPRLEAIPRKAPPAAAQPHSGGKRTSLLLQIIAIVLCAALIALVLLDLKARREEDFSGNDLDSSDIGTIFGDDIPGGDLTDPSDPVSGEDNPGADTTDPSSTTSDQDVTVPGGTEQSGEEKLSLEAQALQLDLEIAVKDGDLEVSTRLSAGEVDGEVNGRVEKDDDPLDFTVEIDLGAYKDCIDVEIENLFGADTKRTEALSVEFDVDSQVLAKMDGEAQYLWEYRLDDSEEWSVLDGELFKTSKEGTAVIRSQALQELFADAEEVEFRLTYTRANKKGGTLTVVVSGIRADAGFIIEKES